MFRILTLLLFLCVGHCVYSAAQPVGSVQLLGMRQGLSFWLTKNGAGRGSLRYPPGQHFTWNKEVFIRARLGKKWVGDAGLMHYSFSNDWKTDSGLPLRDKIHFAQLNLSLQYDISYPLLGYFIPYFLKMQSYAGISLAPRIGFESVVSANAAETSTTNFSVLVGANYSHVLPVSSRLSIFSSISYRSIPLNRFRDNAGDFSNPNRAFSWSGGIGYTFK